jgi:glycosyltransferase involved in cell wall biosynthesis
MSKVLLGTISLDRMAGGLEKNIVLLANFLAGAGHDVELVTFDLPDATAFYALDPRVCWRKVGRTRPHTRIGFAERFALIRRIHAVLAGSTAPIIVCFHHGILFRFWAAALGSRATVVCSERNSLQLYEHVRQTRKWSLNFLLLAVVRRITVQFPAYVDDYPGWLRGRIRVIPNPIEPMAQQAAPATPDSTGRFTLICVGRLCAQKNQLELVRAFARLASRFPQWDLRIVGDGGDRAALETLVTELRLGDRVFLLGKSNQVPDLLGAAHLFCLPSLWEGFPNALAEAMSSGLPAVALRSCAGARDLIEHGVTGLLAGPGELEATLAELMAAPERRAAIGAAAVTLTGRYSPQESFQRWQGLLDELQAPL